jgi:SAM-dependent methyltransferase
LSNSDEGEPIPTITSDGMKYDAYDAEFHEDMYRSLNPIRRWFHNRKAELVHNAVAAEWNQKGPIVDLGCGTVNWNYAPLLPVIGVDVNPRMLERAKELGRLVDMRVAPVQATGLPDGFARVVIISEVLEHLPDYPKVISEIRRILMPGGICIASVPYDTNFSCWKPFFKTHCFVYGTLLGNPYFQKEAGHINHFSPETIAWAFSSDGFEIKRQFDNWRFTIFTIAQKPMEQN